MLTILQKIFFSISYRLKKISIQRILGEGNELHFDGHYFGNTLEVSGNSNELSLKKNSILKKCEIVVKGHNHRLIIGENCKISDTTFWFEGESSLIEVGDGTTIEAAHIAIGEGNGIISIGSDCMFAKNIEIRTSDSHKIFDDQNNRINPPKNVQIEDHVWLGNNVTVLKGVKIESGAIVGNSALITKNVDGRTLVAGNPQRIIKSNVNWER